VSLPPPNAYEGVALRLAAADPLEGARCFIGELLKSYVKALVGISGQVRQSFDGPDVRGRAGYVADSGERHEHSTEDEYRLVGLIIGWATVQVGQPSVGYLHDEVSRDAGKDKGHDAVHFLCGERD
jgi:hypothetical protein